MLVSLTVLATILSVIIVPGLILQNTETGADIEKG